MISSDKIDEPQNNIASNLNETKGENDSYYHFDAYLGYYVYKNKGFYRSIEENRNNDIFHLQDYKKTNETKNSVTSQLNEAIIQNNSKPNYHFDTYLGYEVENQVGFYRCTSTGTENNYNEIKKACSNLQKISMFSENSIIAAEFASSQNNNENQEQINNESEVRKSLSQDIQNCSLAAFSKSNQSFKNKNICKSFAVTEVEVEIIKEANSYSEKNDEITNVPYNTEEKSEIIENNDQMYNVINNEETSLIFIKSEDEKPSDQDLYLEAQIHLQEENVTFETKKDTVIESFKEISNEKNIFPLRPNDIDNFEDDKENVTMKEIEKYEKNLENINLKDDFEVNKNEENSGEAGPKKVNVPDDIEPHKVTETLLSVKEILHETIIQNSEVQQDNALDSQKLTFENIEMRNKVDATLDTFQDGNNEEKNKENFDKNQSDEEEFFCKHFIEPKERKKVQIKSVVDIKPSTPDGSITMSSLERDENEINICETEEEIKAIGNRLIKELDELQKQKQQGYDIYQQYEDLKYKFALARERKLLIKKKAANKKSEILHHDKYDNDEKNASIELKSKIETVAREDFKESNKLIHALFLNLNEENNHQILLFFYNCNSIHKNQFKSLIDDIFDASKNKDLYIALYKNCDNDLIYTDFIAYKTKGELSLHKKEFKSLTEFQNNIPNLRWSTRKNKTVFYLADQQIYKDESDSVIKYGSSSSFISFKKIGQISYYIETYDQY